MATYNPKPIDHDNITSGEITAFLQELHNDWTVTQHVADALDGFADGYITQAYLKRGIYRGHGYRDVSKEVLADPLIFKMYTTFSFDWQGEHQKLLKRSLTEGVRLGFWTLHNPSGSNKGKAAIGDSVLVRINPQALLRLIGMYVPSGYVENLTKALPDPYTGSDAYGFGWYYYYTRRESKNSLHLLYGLLHKDVEIKAIPSDGQVVDYKVLYRLTSNKISPDAFLAQTVFKKRDGKYATIPQALVPSIPEVFLKRRGHTRDVCDQIEDAEQKALKAYKEALAELRECRIMARVKKQLGGYTGIMDTMGKDIKTTLPLKAMEWSILDCPKDWPNREDPDPKFLKKLALQYLGGELPLELK